MKEKSKPPAEWQRRYSGGKRGVPVNPPNRFDPREVVYDGDWLDTEPETPLPQTQFLPDHSRTVLSHNESPDVAFNLSVNPYRGCEHGCAYCYARPTHEYFGLSAGLDFETRIFVKYRAAALLTTELQRQGYRPEPIALSGNTDPYQPIERKLQLTRKILTVLRDFRHPVMIITKNALVTRDTDILSEMARYQLVRIFFSINTLDTRLCGKLEPRTSRPERRLEAIRRLAEAGIPVGVLLAPIIPALMDHEIPQILEAAYQAGARFASYIVLRLPHGVKDILTDWLQTHYPERAFKVLQRLRELRGGQLYRSEFGERMLGQGIYARQIEQLFRTTYHRLGYSIPPPLSTHHFRRGGAHQPTLFDQD